MPQAVVWRTMRRLNRRVASLVASGRGPRRTVLLLGTTGRRTGLRRVTPLQFERTGEGYVVASARGERADWFRNAVADPHVTLQVGDRTLTGVARPVLDRGEIADVLELRRRRHPVMIRLIMMTEGVAPWARRPRLERFAAGKAVLAIGAIEDAEPATDAGFVTQAVDLAVRSVASGGGPFGAVVVRDGVVIGTGHNRVTLDGDPTAHAEVVAIRDACRRSGSYSLAGAELFSSCEPCPLCLSAALWARVGRVVFAADRDDAARAGFDDRAFYELLARDRSTWPMAVIQHRVPGAEAPMDAWLALENRAQY
ncbi:nitroreductase/quinone reductase family protein [Actinotalea lenta]|uniref:nitroreductase/quinone reductase family protein n=1 Tax=Actinotalea lenta TaxID=3064654 RepID=UPI0033130104